MADRILNFPSFSGQVGTKFRLYLRGTGTEIYEVVPTEIEGDDGELTGRWEAHIINISSAVYNWGHYSSEDEPLTTGTVEHTNAGGTEYDISEDLSSGDEETSSESSSESPISEQILELALSPKKIVTDEGSVEERSVREMMDAASFGAGTTDPLFGFHIARAKPGGAVGG